MKYLLDTCVISELVKLKPNPKVVKWINSKHEHDFYLSVLTIGEIQKGISKLSESKKKDPLFDWLNSELLERFEGRILHVDEITAMRWGTIQGELEAMGNKMPTIDGLIAATAQIFELTIVTRNGDDMEKSGVEIINPWI